MSLQIQMLSFCSATVALSIVATLVCLNERGKVNAVLQVTSYNSL